MDRKWGDLPMRGAKRKLKATPANRRGRRSPVESDGAQARCSARCIGVEPGADGARRRRAMILATTMVEDVDRFLDVFSTKGAEKRHLHGSKGSTVFRDPNDEKRVWALFDWDGDGWQSFVSDPEVPPILQAAGHVGRPQAAEIVGRYNA
jgi:hypothetical protein